MRRFDFYVPFILISIGLWAISGTIVGMASFEPVYSTIKNSPPDLAIKSTQDWGKAIFYTVLSWGGLGGIYGLINALIFWSKSSYEHGTLVPQVYSDGPSGGPRTLAELSSGFQCWFIGLIILIIAAASILPNFQTNFLVVRGTDARIGFACVCGIMSVIPVLPFSISWLRTKIRNSHYGYY